MTSGRKQTSVYKDNDVSEFHFENHGIHSKYPTVFSGVGKLNDYQLKVHVNPDIPPVAQPPRLVHFHIRKVVDKEQRA